MFWKDPIPNKSEEKITAMFPLRKKMSYLGIRISGKRIDKNRKEKNRTVLYVSFLIFTKVETLLFCQISRIEVDSSCCS
jgi:hypothetical protein